MQEEIPLPYTGNECSDHGCKHASRSIRTYFFLQCEIDYISKLYVAAIICIMGHLMRVWYVSQFRSTCTTIKLCAPCPFLWDICNCVCLFGLILYVPVNKVPVMSDGSSWVEPVLSRGQSVLLYDTTHCIR